jgi:hypothetical protein
MNSNELAHFTAKMMAENLIADDISIYEMMAAQSDFELTKEHCEEHYKLNYQTYYDYYLNRFIEKWF